MTADLPPISKPARIVLVGHCGPDSWMLKSVVGRVFHASEVVMVNDEQTVLDEVTRADLLLVNRSLDGDFASESGITLIRELVKVPLRRAGVMLVSNFEDAQKEAVGAGASPGFGKSNAGSAVAAERMRAAAVAPRSRAEE